MFPFYKYFAPTVLKHFPRLSLNPLLRLLAAEIAHARTHAAHLLQAAFTPVN